ncbi:6-phosphogluconate phosphatase [Endozoicomonas elysicola]|uniref:Phosphatase n=1 Tax=Endozoicomonas elysicola TaxID=305900 RepID=A0A081K5Y6_9GAMM|nr:6-phosphogluconate phosphatase [Endozoicomonas elysicola]KEI69562.1 phosphatase [Endozoicomonas elysicola]
MTPKTIECVIFDCDGTLVDSEILCNQGLVNVFTRYRALITLEECLTKYKGGKMVEILTAICGDHHLSLNLAELEKEYREELRQLFDKYLTPVNGVPLMLEKIQMPICVASNGPASKMEHTLGLTGLLPRFEGKLFSAFDANCWKPDPGLLAYAAKGMGVNLGKCVLVEDSVPGVMAGINAGIPVFHYCRDEHSEPVNHPLVTRFANMEALPSLLLQAD